MPFLGLIGYYRRFVKNYAFISFPLIEIIKKDAFSWSEEALTSFNNLRHTMAQTPVLALPNFTKKNFVTKECFKLWNESSSPTGGTPYLLF